MMARVAVISVAAATLQTAVAFSVSSSLAPVGLPTAVPGLTGPWCAQCGALRKRGFNGAVFTALKAQRGSGSEYSEEGTSRCQPLAGVSLFVLMTSDLDLQTRKAWST